MPSYSVGDVVIVTIAGTNSVATSGTHSSNGSAFTEISTQQNIPSTSAVRLSVWYRVMQSGDSSSYAWTASTSQGFHALAASYSGVNASNVVNIANFSLQSSASTTITIPSVTTNVDGCQIVHIASQDDQEAKTGYTGSERMTWNSGTTGISTPGNGTNVALGDRFQASFGATGAESITIASEESCGFTVALEPAPTGGNFDQDSFRGRNDNGSETTATWKDTANTNWSQRMDENFRIRFLVEELDDVEDLDVQFQLQYNRNAAGWNDVNGASTYARSSASSNFADGDTTTEQLNGPGTFITNNNGMDETEGLAGGTGMDFTTTANQEVEVEHCLQLRSADFAKGDTVQFRLVKEADITFGSYTNTPTITPVFDNLVQASFRSRNDNGSETTATWKQPLNTNWTQAMDVNFRIRFLIQETNNWLRNDFSAQLQYNLNGGGWNNVNAASSVARSAASASLTDGDDTTQQLGGGTFISNNDGVDEVDGASGGANLDFAGSDEAEVEYCLQLRSADLSEGDTVQFRISGMDIYSQTPTVTPQFPTHFIMVTSTNLEENEPTTQQLTAQSGTFVPGTISESTPEADPPITVVSRGYTEYEFCIEATTSAVNGAQYEFRLADEDQSGEKLEVYTVTPRVTLAP